MFEVFGIRRAVQVVSLPVWAGVSETIREEVGFPIVYDCHDLLSGFEQISPLVAGREAALLETADLVVFSSEWLARNAAPSGKLPRQSLILRNAVDFDYFAAASGENRQAGRKVIGYAGSLNHWFDVEAVEAAAQRYPEYRFVLLGRIEHDSVRRLGRLSNVEMGGEVPYSELPARMAEFDVALIPFRRTPLTLATNPIKLYEYFSLGLPVVSAKLPEVEPHGELVYLAGTAAEFAQHVGCAAAESDPDLRERRREIARRENWAARARTLAGALRALLPAG
jgi:glycosyltransferase involved in cell wall biosynthesis